MGRRGPKCWKKKTPSTAVVHPLSKGWIDFQFLPPKIFSQSVFSSVHSSVATTWLPGLGLPHATYFCCEKMTLGVLFFRTAPSGCCVHQDPSTTTAAVNLGQVAEPYSCASSTTRARRFDDPHKSATKKVPHGARDPSMSPEEGIILLQYYACMVWSC